MLEIQQSGDYGRVLPEGTKSPFVVNGVREDVGGRKFNRLSGLKAQTQSGEVFLMCGLPVFALHQSFVHMSVSGPSGDIQTDLRRAPGLPIVAVNPQTPGIMGVPPAISHGVNGTAGGGNSALNGMVSDRVGVRLMCASVSVGYAQCHSNKYMREGQTYAPADLCFGAARRL